jgi:hypothetical protein
MTKRLGKKAYRALCETPWYRSLSRSLTFFWFTFSLLWFWSDAAQLHGFAHHIGALAFVVIPVFVVVAAGVLSLCKAVGDRFHAADDAARNASFALYGRVALTAALVVLTVSVSVVMNAPAATIVYKAF